MLSDGGFVKVYEGVLRDNTKLGCWKRSTDYESPDRDAVFEREVEMISVAIHRNLSRLIGFCPTPTERLLVYPFMQNLHTYHYNSKTHSCSSSILKAHLSRLMLVWDLESRHLVSTLLHLPPYSNSQVPSSNSLISKLCYLLVQKMLMLAMSRLRTSGICSYFWSWKESHE